MTKDWCSWFPEYVFGIYIGDICKDHDHTCSTSGFYRKLEKRLMPLTFGHELASIIAFGGSIGCWIKYTKHMLTKKD